MHDRIPVPASGSAAIDAEDLLAKRSDVHAQVLHIGLRTPHLAQDHIVRQHLAGMRHEQPQQIILPWRELHFLAAHGDDAPYQINGEVPGAEYRLLALLLQSMPATKLQQASVILLGKLATYEFAYGGRHSTFPRRLPETHGTASTSLVVRSRWLDPGYIGAVCRFETDYGLVGRIRGYTNSFSYNHVGPMTWTAAANHADYGTRKPRTHCLPTPEPTSSR